MRRLRVLIAQCVNRSEHFVRKADDELFDVTAARLVEHRNFREFDCVIPMRISDSRYLARWYRRLNGHKFFVPPRRALKTADDKILFNRFLQQQGFSNHLPQVDPADRFPYVLKKNKDLGGVNSFIVKDESDEEVHAALLANRNYFTQPYIPGDVEYTDHIFFAGGQIVHSCTIMFCMNQELYIRGTRMQPYENVQMEVIEPAHSDVFANILTSLNFEGICCFNYKVVDGTPIIFELNPRVGGSAHMDINRFLLAMQKTIRPLQGTWQNFRQDHLPF